MAIRDFVVEVVPYQAAVARTNLTAQGFGVFYPTVIKTRKHPRFQSLNCVYEEPLFSGYVFVSFDPHDLRWRSINGTRGVKRLICNGETPVAMPIGVMEELQAAHANGLFNEAVAPPSLLKLGVLGQVASGPFSGFTGECLISEVKRILLNLDIFGRRTPTWLTPDAVVAA